MTDAANLTRKTITVGAGTLARGIAIIHRAARKKTSGPAFVWLGGYRSDMTGTKAVELDALAGELGLSSIRFDYSGHGASGGAFRDGTISRWLEEAIAVLDDIRPKRVILVGSSMGGWITLRLVQELKKRKRAAKVDGIVLIAPAPDFTAELIEPMLTEVERQSLSERGYFEERSEYSTEPNIYTRDLIEDGRKNSVMTGIIETGCPVHILQGMKDPDVPYAHALKLVEFLPADDVVLTLIRDGDHRLSRPQDIEKLRSAVSALILND
ncbi:alpha/beta hydrolase [Neorhizobium galegae]|uniref:Palmitoyl-protein thioesterase ABHD10, mitochondrial n=1 Tax=Neorhizobium galegae bv. orientalis str. HAMBI 540 TaxID=1028800 RepID=A0A068SWG7_NEOGA|nr:alpha/beta hydrolase [Neorhizobium galegae]CDN50573.1 Putative hydrolase or acyltransferase of alpha/beta superfamily [Neorhizobium galegae bv. orientalis str. HAMBI 540]